MTRSSAAKFSASSGEVSPLLYGRPDYQRHQTGVRGCNGFLPLKEGGLTRAPGSRYRGNSDANNEARTIDFEFAVDDALTLEFTEFKMRVWRYGALVGAPYELVTPYDLAAVKRLQYVQSADVIYLADGVLPMQKLSRFALDNWTIEAFEPDDGPFKSENVETAHTIQASAATGSVTLTASQDTFTADMIGGLLSLKPFENPDIPLWTSNTNVANGTKIRNEGNTYEKVSGGTTGVVAPIHLEGDEKVDANTGIVWRFIDDGFGIVRITAVTSATEATATVIRTIPDACVQAPTYLWAEGAWSPKNGYPAALEIIDDRLVAAATMASPRTIFFSAIGGFTTWRPGTDADDAFAYAVSGSRSTNRIVWLKATDQGLAVGTIGQVLSARSTIERQAIGATSFELSIDAEIGVHTARPTAPDGRPIFISRSKDQLLEMRFKLDDNANRPIDLSGPASHLGDAGFEQIIWQLGPHRRGWIRRSDGTLAVMLHDPEEDVLGWAPLSMAGGFVESLAVTPDATTGKPIISAMVRRQVGGSTVRFFEELAPVFGVLPKTTAVADAEHLYAAVTFSGAEADTFSVPHLAGEEVYAWTNRGIFGPITADGAGQVVLPSLVTQATIGLHDDTHESETLHLRPRAPDGDTLGRQTRILEGSGLRVHQTAQLKVGTIARSFTAGKFKDQPREILRRQIAGELTEVFSGVVPLELSSDHTPEAGLFFQPVPGAPATILGVTPLMDEGGA